MTQTTELKKEFKDKFAITATPSNNEDYIKAFLLEKFWKEEILNEIADWWLSRTLPLSTLEELEKAVEQLKKDELSAKPADDLEKTAEWYKIQGLDDVLSIIKSYKVKEEI